MTALNWKKKAELDEGVAIEAVVGHSEVLFLMLWVEWEKFWRYTPQNALVLRNVRRDRRMDKAYFKGARERKVWPE